MKLFMLEPRVGLYGEPHLERGKFYDIESEREWSLLVSMGRAVQIPTHPGENYTLSSKAYHHLLSLAGYKEGEMFISRRGA
jgi:hypothetical protein